MVFRRLELVAAALDPVMKKKRIRKDRYRKCRMDDEKVELAV